MSTLSWIVFALVFLVAILYASVGYGGASGYLAAMSLFAFPRAQMSTTALLLNFVVAGMAWAAFWKVGHGSRRLIQPFLITSIPFALLGGWMKVSSHAYHWLLAIALGTAAIRLCLPAVASSSTAVRGAPPAPVAWGVGSVIGLVSGIVGVGGGIFLSPIMILCRWADAKQTAAASACFIVINSASGLLGRLASGSFETGPLLPLIGAAAAGGWIGSVLGANRLPNPALCRVLAGVLSVAVVKWLTA